MTRITEYYENGEVRKESSLDLAHFQTTNFDSFNSGLRWVGIVDGSVSLAITPAGGGRLELCYVPTPTVRITTTFSTDLDPQGIYDRSKLTEATHFKYDLPYGSPFRIEIGIDGVTA